ncbi:MAG: RecQ family ATP-dependent DNA helicase, partial [Bacteroidaceae bacterium]|nr:RecQ family ATP-dependent DNA helicase [Bacteroidaceae bacterium]
MSIWSKLIGIKRTEEKNNPIGGNTPSVPCPTPNYAIVDVEVGLNDHRIHDIGALKHNDTVFHKNSKEELFVFLNDTDYICGHNIIHHDAKYLFPGKTCRWALVDTLYLSPLLFPERPYHRLVKDDKLVCEQMNNPVNDCKKAKDLLLDEMARWNSLPKEKRILFASLLKDKKEFEGFLSMVHADYIHEGIPDLIKKLYAGKICQHADFDTLIRQYPCGLAYALALIDTTDYRSVTPGWVLHNYPEVEFIVKLLRHTNCHEGCDYCHTQLDVLHNLKAFFGYERFRTYEGEPLQERAARAAVEGKSLLAIFPTGGGKSLTFQLPALMAGRSVHGLTVVISPLQSLMKDQVDNLADKGITDAVTINGMSDPITRALSIQRVQDGDASLLYISPEMLRSKTIERILFARHVVRFVIDEAHCFSAWGQDFRVDYLYIGKFIRKYQQQKNCNNPIPVSCFTATAKQKVIQDICDYFRQTLDLNLELFASTASRTNLHYSVIHTENDNDKYLRLRELVAESDCPTIIYVSRTKRTEELARKLTRDGHKALPFNGKMEADEKIANQEAFMSDRVRIIVATSAFGMGVDKKDVGLVIHYDISDSLENYVQEAGRAGRDPNLNARCYVLYGDNDLDKHFILINQTKLSISEIQQVWKAVKILTRSRMKVSCSALEIARQAGWDDSVSDIETRVRTALAALEQNGYLIRGNNVPHVYATGITVKNMDEARTRISASVLFDNDDMEKAVRIIKSLISQKHTAKNRDSEAESRIDYLADILGLSKKEVISVVERMRQEGILADSKDISAYLQDAGDSERKSQMLLERFAKLEQYILNHIPDETLRISYKQLNENAVNEGISTSKEKDIRTLLYFLTIKGYTHKKEDAVHNMEISRQTDLESTIRRFEKRLEISRFTVDWLYKLASDAERGNEPDKAIQFSVIELLHQIKSNTRSLFGKLDDIQLEDVEEALLYLSKIGALKLEGGFLVLYNAMNIQRIKDNKSRYKQDDYRMLNEFYKQKIQQVHIVGEYANLMVRDYRAALQYVQDYFQMDYRKFVTKYFKGDRANEIQRNLTPQKYDQLFGQLSKRQMEIISNKDSRCIVVGAGPGSGKTRVLVHKLASLLLLEDVKHEQLLMLTFSRAAATEFKQRLMELIGNAAHFVEIKTFHSYCFDLLGRIGNLEDSKNIVAKAAGMICQGEVEPNKIGKTVLVIDEAQDMGTEEHALVKACHLYTYQASDESSCVDRG